jgi:glutamate racemase
VSVVGIFDSGVGGLTVQKAILERLPGLDTVYLGDTARVPYGSKSPEARAAARASRSGRIGVIGTPSTVASGAYQRALREARPEAEVVARACPLFVPLAEEGWTDPDDEVVRAVARRYLAPLAGAGVDALVLGCTHYPLLKGAIARELPGVALVDSAESIAAEVEDRVGGAPGRAALPRRRRALPRQVDRQRAASGHLSARGRPRSPACLSRNASLIRRFHVRRLDGPRWIRYGRRGCRVRSRWWRASTTT